MSQSAGTVPLLYVNLLFLGCHHFFSVERNRRAFCWTVEDAARLLCAIKERMQTDETLDLSSIILTNTADRYLTDRQKSIIKKEPNMVYDMHDGQNRLIAICLLIAALRDLFLFYSTKTDGLTIVLTVPEDDCTPIKDKITALSNLLAPQVRGTREPRIVLSEGDRPFIDGLLLEPNPISDEPEKPPAQRARVDVSAVTSKMTQIYDFLIDELRTMVTESVNPTTGRVYYDVCPLYHLQETIETQVRFIVFKIAEERIALDLVMNQTLGKPVELVDHFKFLLCRSNNDSDSTHVQEENVKKWDNLCSETSRDLVKTAGLYLAQINSGTELQLDGHEFNRAMDFFKQYAEAELAAHDTSGSLVFSSFESTVRKLHSFRTESYTELCSNFDVDEQTAISSSCQFLIFISRIPRGKQIEVAVFDVLKRFGGFQQLKRNLLALESIALWMVTCGPTFAARRSRVLRILAELREEPPAEGAGLELSFAEKANIQQALEMYSVKSRNDKLFVKALLLRLNLRELGDQGKTLVLATTSKTVFLESIVSTPEAAQDSATGSEGDSSYCWTTSCLGNFVVTVVRPAVHTKRERLRQCLFPLSDHVAALDEWSAATLLEYKQRILSMASSLWLGAETQNDATEQEPPAANGDSVAV